jgi:hypothetical protein
MLCNFTEQTLIMLRVQNRLLVSVSCVRPIMLVFTKICFFATRLNSYLSIGLFNVRNGLRVNANCVTFIMLVFAMDVTLAYD